jgi:tetratricopeptide (TPR) repeat protein
MLGLASVYLKQNNYSLAQNFYARLLELNPRDPLARAGLLETIQDDPVRQEAELKSLINAFPGTAPLSYALGNLYVSQNRWNEAQTAYFDALLAAKSANTGPISPDYSFNLAVSLEHINQLRSALDYYREAAVFARNAAPGFDPAQLQQRLNYLEQRLP